MVSVFKFNKQKIIFLFFLFFVKSIFLFFTSISSVLSFQNLIETKFLFFVIWLIIDFFSFFCFYLLGIYIEYKKEEYCEIYTNKYKFYLINSISQKNDIAFKNFGYYFSLLEDDLPVIKSNIFFNYINIFDYLLSFIFLSSALLYFSWIIFLIVIFFVVILKLTTFFLSKITQTLVKKQLRYQNFFWENILNFLNGFNKFFYQNKKKIFFEILMIKNQKRIKKNINYEIKNSAIHIISTTIIILSQSIIVFIIGFLYYKNFILIGVFLVITGISTQFINLAEDTTQLFLELLSTKNIKTKIENFFYTKKANDFNVIKSIEKIELKNISFSYRKNKIIFYNFSYIFEKNKKYLITGLNGRGKSTLLKIIVGFLKPQKGEVLINNININKIDLSKLMECITFLEKDSYIFNDANIESNISLFDKNFNKNNYLFSLNKSLVDFNKNQNLSSGQKQRINIARFFYLNKNFVILDESLSNIDKYRRKIIEKNILSLKNTSVIHVAHNNLIENHVLYDEILNL